MSIRARPVSGSCVCAVARPLDQDHYQGGPDKCLDQVATDDTAIGFAENRMEMQGWALIADRDIAEQLQDIDLLVDGDFLLLLGFPHYRQLLIAQGGNVATPRWFPAFVNAVDREEVRSVHAKRCRR